MIEVTDLPIEEVRSDPDRIPVRRRLCPRVVDQLVRTVRRHPNVLPPILVWPDPATPGRYLVVSGCHRLEAVRLAGLTHIMASVLRERSEEDVATLALIELTHPGQPGSAWDTAQAVGVLHRCLGEPSARALADRAQRGRTQVARYLRVAAELPEGDVREALHSAGIEPGALHRLPLSCLYAAATSDHPRLEGRVRHLVEEVRRRQPPQAAPPTSQQSGAVASRQIAIVRQISIGIVLLLVLASLTVWIL